MLRKRNNVKKILLVVLLIFTLFFLYTFEKVISTAFSLLFCHFEIQIYNDNLRFRQDCQEDYAFFSALRNSFYCSNNLIERFFSNLNPLLKILIFFVQFIVLIIFIELWKNFLKNYFPRAYRKIRKKVIIVKEKLKL